MRNTLSKTSIRVVIEIIGTAIILNTTTLTHSLSRTSILAFEKVSRTAKTSILVLSCECVKVVVFRIILVPIIFIITCRQAYAWSFITTKTKHEKRFLRLKQISSKNSERVNKITMKVVYKSVVQSHLLTIYSVNPPLLDQIKVHSISGVGDKS